MNLEAVPMSCETVDSDIFTSHVSTLVKPKPIPPFVFPMQPPQVKHTRSGDEEQVNTSDTTSRNSRARTRPQRISINAPLPAFDFHPSSTDMALPHKATLPESPIRSVAIPPRAAGHRRGGSEFIGGDGTSGGLGLMSTSPTKGEGVLPQPQVSRLGPPGMRRGHVHRRSGAISSHDLSTILRPSGESTTRSGSAPTTPSDPSYEQQFRPGFDRSNSHPMSASSQSISDLHAPRDGPTLSSHRSRPRVGFSDTLEFIPRPLSTISSDTSSSLSTIRAAHSVTGSITSVVSGGTPSPPSAQKSSAFFEPTVEYSSITPRPRTANAALELSSPEEPFEENAKSAKRPSSATSSPHAFMSSSTMPMLSDPTNLSRNGGHWQIGSQGDFTFNGMQTSSPISFPSSEDILKSSTPKGFRSANGVTKPHQRNAKKWTGGILSRKGKQQITTDILETPRSPRSLVRGATPEHEFSLDDVNFDEDNTFVIRAPQHDPVPAMKTDYSSLNPHLSGFPMDSDITSPMLDLDAALGPFNTPDNGNISGFSSARRRMHSSGITGGFDGPGMHYHRRAESAPEMAPIHYSTFGLNRLGSDSTMTDVFEEDEDNEFTSSETVTQKDARDPEGNSDQQMNGLGVQIIDIGDEGNLPPDRHRCALEPEAFDEVPKSEISSMMPPTPILGLAASRKTSEEAVPVEIVDGNEEPRFSVATKSSDESTITPRLSIDPLAPRPNSAPLEFTLPSHRLPFDTPETASSAVSSPDCASTSFDFPRLNTAHSSFTDRTTWSSSRGGDHGKDQGYSADDVPSLTSSASTMISAQPARLSNSAMTRLSGERASSLTAAAPSQTRSTSTGKRSSLVSLSRLVGGSHGERSKLSIESHPQPDDPNKQEKKKGKRMSRIFRFWSPKGKPKTS